MECNNNTISITMPVVKEYAQILRLTASGVFNQAGFDIEKIQDVKVAVSEVFNCLLQSDTVMFTVTLMTTEEAVIMEFTTCDQQEVLRGANDMTLPIIETFVSTVSISENGVLTLSVDK